MKDLSEMNKKDRKEVLIDVAKEIQDICEFEPSIKTDRRSEKEIIGMLTEAHAALEPEDELSEKAIAVFEFMGLIESDDETQVEKKAEKKAEMKVAEDTSEDESNLVELVTNAKKLKDLKELVKTNDEFEGVRSQLSGYSSIKSLKSYMLKILSGEAKAPVEKTPPAKKEPKPKAAKKEGTPKPRGTGVIATIQASIEKAGKKGISKEGILEKLVAAFPDRDPDSMSKSIRAQVPNRMSKEKGIKIGTTKKGDYFIE
jgi:hypothetical protein